MYGPTMVQLASSPHTAAHRDAHRCDEKTSRWGDSFRAPGVSSSIVHPDLALGQYCNCRNLVSSTEISTRSPSTNNCQRTGPIACGRRLAGQPSVDMEEQQAPFERGGFGRRLSSPEWINAGPLNFFECLGLGLGPPTCLLKFENTCFSDQIIGNCTGCFVFDPAWRNGTTVAMPKAQTSNCPCMPAAGVPPPVHVASCVGLPCIASPCALLPPHAHSARARFVCYRCRRVPPRSSGEQPLPRRFSF